MTEIIQKQKNFTTGDDERPEQPSTLRNNFFITQMKGISHTNC
jgi:hypothetical protein